MNGKQESNHLEFQKHLRPQALAGDLLKEAPDVENHTDLGSRYRQDTAKAPASCSAQWGNYVVSLGLKKPCQRTGQDRPTECVFPSLSTADLVPDHVSALRLRNQGHHMCTMVGFTAPGNWEGMPQASHPTIHTHSC